MRSVERFSYFLLLLCSSSIRIEATLQHRPAARRSSSSPVRLHSSVTAVSAPQTKDGAMLTHNHPQTLPMLSKKIFTYTLISGVVGYVAYQHRAVWLPLLDKELIQQKTLDLLQTLQPAPDASLTTRLLSYSQYVVGMALWECGGLSTIPVETAAGMVWGWPGSLLSLLGKLLGASLAFVLGRTLLAERIRQQVLQGNSALSLLMSNNDGTPQLHPPLVTAFYMKFSCFPEGIKNFGSACIPSLHYWMFLLVTFLHGGLFTCIWTWLGVDAAARLRDATLPTNGPLQVALGAALFVGVVLTPLLMAGWMRDLQRHAVPMKPKKPSPLSSLRRSVAPVSLPRQVPSPAPSPTRRQRFPMTHILEHWSLAQLWTLAALVQFTAYVVRSA
jgi:uncharacterized membrane protein YdjX (TVP38/TMEM64 family)